MFGRLFKKEVRVVSTGATPEQVESVLERPDVQAQLRRAGLDPAVLEQQLRDGHGEVHDGKVTLRFSTSVQTHPADGAMAVPSGAHVVTDPAEFQRMLDVPGFLEQFQAQGMDRAAVEAAFKAGKVSAFESHETKTAFRDTFDAPPSAAPPASTPPPEWHAPPSEAGDEIWKKGKL